MRIRAANSADFEAVCLFCESLSSNFDRRILSLSFPRLVEDRNVAVRIAEVENMAADFIEVHLLWSLQSGPHALIRALFVSDAYRRMGVARALVQSAEDWANSSGAENILVQSKVDRTVADAFYIHEGYSRFKVQNVYKRKLPNGD